MKPIKNVSRLTGALRTFPTNTDDVSVLPSLPGAVAQPSLMLWNHVKEPALSWRRSSISASGPSVGTNQGLLTLHCQNLVFDQPLEHVNFASSFIGVSVSLVVQIVASPSTQGASAVLENCSMMPFKYGSSFFAQQSNRALSRSSVPIVHSCLG